MVSGKRGAFITGCAAALAATACMMTHAFRHRLDRQSDRHRASRSMPPLAPPPPPPPVPVPVLTAVPRPGCPLACSDVALIEFLRALDKKQDAHDKFIVEGDLGDTHLLVKVCVRLLLGGWWGREAGGRQAARGTRRCGSGGQSSDRGRDAEYRIAASARPPPWSSPPAHPLCPVHVLCVPCAAG